MYLLKPYLLLHGLLLLNHVELYLNLMNMKKIQIMHSLNQPNTGKALILILVLTISISQRIFCLLFASWKKKSDKNFVEKGYMENRY